MSTRFLKIDYSPPKAENSHCHEFKIDIEYAGKSMAIVIGFEEFDEDFITAKRIIMHITQQREDLAHRNLTQDNRELKDKVLMIITLLFCQYKDKKELEKLSETQRIYLLKAVSDTLIKQGRNDLSSCFKKEIEQLLVNP